MRPWFTRILALSCLAYSLSAQALSLGDWFLDPHVAVGFNSEQGTVLRLGVDAGLHLDENIALGVGGFYAAGNHADHDREIGVGPFVAYAYPVFSFLTVQLREDIDYVDVHVPIASGNPPVYNSHATLYGVESATSAGAHLSFAQSVGISVGYRLVVGLSGNDIAEGRSGAYLGLSIGF